MLWNWLMKCEECFLHWTQHEIWVPLTFMSKQTTIVIDLHKIVAIYCTGQISSIFDKCSMLQQTASRPNHTSYMSMWPPFPEFTHAMLLPISEKTSWIVEPIPKVLISSISKTQFSLHAYCNKKCNKLYLRIMIMKRSRELQKFSWLCCTPILNWSDLSKAHAEKEGQF